jgi:DNA-binding SARP family transcriptional activator
MTKPATAVQLMLAQQPMARMADGRELALNERDAALLALLAVAGPQPRARASEWLWPGAGEETARNRLRQRLFKLRRLCGHPVVEGQAMLVLAAAVRHDLADADTLLGALPLDQCPAFGDWLHAERQRRLLRRRESLARQIDALEAAGEFGAALPLAETLLELDALSEAAHRRLMRLHYLRGDRAAALLAFDRCAQVLKDEVGAAPSAATMQLLDSLQRVEPPTRLASRRQVPASVLRPPRMVGRQALRRRIVHELQGGAVVAVVGDAGMGKSRLLAELGLDLGPWVAAAARPGDAGVPFSSLARLLRELMRRAPASADAAPRRDIARLVPELGPLAPEGPQRHGLALEQAVQAWLAAAGPVVPGLVFDDLHFADEASLDMLQALAAPARTDSGMRWLLAMRPAEAGSRAHALLDALAEAGRLMVAPLEPLSVADLAELVDVLCLPGLHGALLGGPLHQQCGGNPLFALETIKQLLLNEPDAAGAGTTALPRPASVLALIERRLARLSTHALALARVAAVAGTDFSIHVAESVLAQPGLLLSDAWTELEQAHVLRDSAFAHDLVFEAVARGIPAPIARHTHAQVAAYLACHGGVAARVAGHWLQARRPTEALPWLKQAAHGAGQALRTKEQFDFLLQACEIEEQAGARQSAFETLLAAMLLEGKGGRSLDLGLSGRLEALADTPAQVARARFERMSQLMLMHRIEEASQAGRDALAVAETAGDSELVQRIRHGLGTALAFAGHHHEAIKMMLGAEAWVEAHAAQADRADFYNNLAVVLDNAGQPRQAQAYYQRNIAAERALGRWYSVAGTLANLALSRIYTGDVDAALLELQEAERLYTLYDSSEPASPFSAFPLSLCTRLKGRFQDAAGWAETALERSQAIGGPGLTAQARLKQIELWIDLGQFARAEHQLEELERTEDLPLSVRVNAWLARARAQRWRGERAGEALARAQALLPAGARPDLQHRILLEQSYAESPLQAMALTERMLDEARAIGHDGTVMAAWSRRAGALWAHDPALAAAAARRALALADRVDSAAQYRPELWLDAARALGAAGAAAEAQAALERARDWVRACVRSGQVAEPFVDSFLHRNPVNRDLLALAG